MVHSEGVQPAAPTCRPRGCLRPPSTRREGTAGRRRWWVPPGRWVVALGRLAVAGPAPRRVRSAHRRAARSMGAYAARDRKLGARLAGQYCYVAEREARLLGYMTLDQSGYIDLAFVRRLMCSEFCPYGRFQTALVDKSTLTLHLPESELKRCIECGSCVRACPMEIDIRRGYQVECINCGRCLDACRQVMFKRNEPGLIRYTFGLNGAGAKGLLNLRTLLLGTALIVLATILFVAIIERPAASLKVSVSHTAATRQLADGKQGTFFNAWINNRSQTSAVYTLHARRYDNGVELVIKGQIKAELAPGGNRRLDFIVLTLADESLPIEFVLTDSTDMELSVAKAYIEANRED